MRVERVVSNSVLTLVETQSEQVEGRCRHLRVRLLEGNASASFTSAHTTHSTCLRCMSAQWLDVVGEFADDAGLPWHSDSRRSLVCSGTRHNQMNSRQGV